MNKVIVNGKKRTIHDPQKADFYILRNSKVPGVIVEVAFLSNEQERELLLKDEFTKLFASTIASGIENYFSEISSNKN